MFAVFHNRFIVFISESDETDLRQKLGPLVSIEKFENLVKTGRNLGQTTVNLREKILSRDNRHRSKCTETDCLRSCGLQPSSPRDFSGLQTFKRSCVAAIALQLHQSALDTFWKPKHHSF